MRKLFVLHGDFVTTKADLKQGGKRFINGGAGNAINTNYNDFTERSGGEIILLSERDGQAWRLSVNPDSRSDPQGKIPDIKSMKSTGNTGTEAIFDIHAAPAEGSGRQSLLPLPDGIERWVSPLESLGWAWLSWRLTRAALSAMGYGTTIHEAPDLFTAVTIYIAISGVLATVVNWALHRFIHWLFRRDSPKLTLWGGGLGDRSALIPAWFLSAATAAAIVFVFSELAEHSMTPYQWLCLNAWTYYSWGLGQVASVFGSAHTLLHYLHNLTHGPGYRWSLIPTRPAAPPAALYSSEISGSVRWLLGLVNGVRQAWNLRHLIEVVHRQPMSPVPERIQRRILELESGGIRFVTARPQHQEAAIHLFRQAFPDDDILQFEMELSLALGDGPRNYPQSYLLLALESQEIVGMGLRHLLPSGKAAHLRAISVTKNRQREGIGMALIGHLIGRILEEWSDVRHITLNAKSGNGTDHIMQDCFGLTPRIQIDPLEPRKIHGYVIRVPERGFRGAPWFKRSG